MDYFKHPIEQLVHSTVRIECITSIGLSSGTGYFFQFFQSEETPITCIVTNKHVVKDSIVGKFFLSKKASDGNIDLGQHILFEVDDFESKWIFHPDPNVDLAILPLTAELLNLSENAESEIYFVSIGENSVANEKLLTELSTMEDIIMLGYPSGLWDKKHNLPIIRKGITATHPKLSYNGKPEFLIDAACFPGSSGSPVFLSNIGTYINGNGTLSTGYRIILLGTLYAGPQHTITGEIQTVTIPTDTKIFSVSSITMNLGLVIHASKLKDFESILKNI